MSNPIVTVVSLIAFMITVTFHEYCHGLTGYLLGDDTAKRHGRLSLNPLVHIDPIGTLALPLLGALTGLPVFGWAKPVPYNPYNLRFGKWGAVMVSLAGPFSNVAVAIFSILLVKVLAGPMGFAPNNLLLVFLVMLAVVSLVLAAFNFLPISPLDGARLVSALLDSPKYQNIRFFLETKGPVILLVVIMVDFLAPISILDQLFSFIIKGFFGIFGALPVAAAVFSVM